MSQPDPADSGAMPHAMAVAAAEADAAMYPGAIVIDDAGRQAILLKAGDETVGCYPYSPGGGEIRTAAG